MFIGTRSSYHNLDGNRVKTLFKELLFFLTIPPWLHLLQHLYIVLSNSRLFVSYIYIYIHILIQTYTHNNKYIIVLSVFPHWTDNTHKGPQYSCTCAESARSGWRETGSPESTCLRYTTAHRIDSSDFDVISNDSVSSLSQQPSVLLFFLSCFFFFFFI